MSREIATDLSLHLQEQIGEVIRSNSRLAAKAISRADAYRILIEAAVWTTLSVAATIASNADGSQAQAALFDETVAQGRERSLTAAAQGKGRAA